MDSKIDGFILFLKTKYSLNQEDISQKLGMGATIFSRSKSKNPDDLLKKMQIKFNREWKEFLSMDDVQMGVPDELEQAQLIVIMNWLVKMKSEMTGKSVDEIIAEYDADIKLVLRNLSK